VEFSPPAARASSTLWASTKWALWVAAAVEVVAGQVPVVAGAGGPLALTLAEPTLVEDVEDAGFGQLGILDGPSPVRISAGGLTLTGADGLGFSFS
jgi:hypothetical protein